MKKIKILAMLCTTAVVATASPYVGIQVGDYFLKNKQEMKVKSLIGGLTQLEEATISKDADLNGIRFGIIAGYAHKIKEKVDLLIEGDIIFGNKKKTIKYDTSSLNTSLTHRNENASIKTGLGFGIMPALRFQINDKLHGLVGLRFAAKNYEVKAWHINRRATTAAADNMKTEKKYLFSFEPNVGAQYDFSDKVSGRFMLGYNFGSRKNMIDNYLNSTAMQNQAVNNVKPSASSSINPKGIVIKAMITYNF